MRRKPSRREVQGRAVIEILASLDKAYRHESINIDDIHRIIAMVASVWLGCHLRVTTELKP
jgi:hypothetical protein